MNPTTRPVVTAEHHTSYERNQCVDLYDDVVRTDSTPGVTVRVEFDLHDHGTALAVLERAVADVRAQIEETS